MVTDLEPGFITRCVPFAHVHAGSAEPSWLPLGDPWWLHCENLPRWFPQPGPDHPSDHPESPPPAALGFLTKHPSLGAVYWGPSPGLCSVRPRQHFGVLVTRGLWQTWEEASSEELV